jgi:hypothetical protein
VVNRAKSRLIATIKLATFGLIFGHFYLRLPGICHYPDVKCGKRMLALSILLAVLLALGSSALWTTSAGNLALGVRPV